MYVRTHTHICICMCGHILIYATSLISYKSLGAAFRIISSYMSGDSFFPSIYMCRSYVCMCGGYTHVHETRRASDASPGIWLRFVYTSDLQAGRKLIFEVKTMKTPITCSVR